MPKSPLGVVLAVLVTIGALLFGQRAGLDAQNHLSYDSTLNMSINVSSTEIMILYLQQWQPPLTSSNNQPPLTHTPSAPWFSTPAPFQPPSPWSPSPPALRRGRLLGMAAMLRTARLADEAAAGAHKVQVQIMSTAMLQLGLLLDCVSEMVWPFEVRRTQAARRRKVGSEQPDRPTLRCAQRSDFSGRSDPTDRPFAARSAAIFWVGVTRPTDPLGSWPDTRDSAFGNGLAAESGTW